MSQRISRKELKHDEFVESAADFGQWVEDHWKTVVKVFGATVVVAVLGFVWVANRKSEAGAAKLLLARAVQKFEEVEAAGFTHHEKMETVLEAVDKAVSRAGSSQTGAVARFYRGVLLLHLDRVPESIKELEGVIAKADGTLFVSAHSVLAEAYVANGRTDDAVKQLQKLLDPPHPTAPQDQVLLQLGRIQHSAGRVDEARQSWQRIIDDHPQSAAAGEARQLLDS